jgi:TubC N-terminal docking domain
MTAAELMAELTARQVKIEAVNGRLRLDAPKGALAPRLRAALTEHKAELLTLLERDVGIGDSSRAEPTSGENCPPTEVGAEGMLHIPPGGTIRIPLDDLACGDFLARHKLRIVGGAAYPDGRTYRPTIYLADVD